MEHLDPTDALILDLLQRDGSMTNVELARRVDLAPATTLERVRKLRARGILRDVVALVDAPRVGRGTVAFVAVSLASHQREAVASFRDQVAALDDVLECYHTSGESDYLIKVVTRDIQTYEDFLLHRLTAIANIGKIHTSFVLSTVKHETRIPLDPPDVS